MTASNNELPHRPGTVRQIPFSLWVALLFLPIEVLLIFIVLSMLLIIPFHNWAEIWRGIGYFSLLAALVFTTLIFIPHQPGTVRQIPFSLWVPVLSIPVEFLLVSILVVVFTPIFQFFLALFPQVSGGFQIDWAALSVGMTSMWLISAAAIVINLRALRNLWRQKSLPGVRLITMIPYGIVLLPNLFFFTHFILQILSGGKF